MPNMSSFPFMVSHILKAHKNDLIASSAGHQYWWLPLLLPSLATNRNLIVFASFSYSLVAILC